MNNFPVLLEHTEAVSLLDDAQAGMLLKALMQYAQTGTVDDLPLPVMLMFKVMALQIDSYAETSRKRAEAGRNGGVAKSSKSKQNLAKPSKTKQTEASADTDEVCLAGEREKEAKREREYKENDSLTAITKEDAAPVLSEAPVADAWKEFVQMRKQIKKPLTPGAEARARLTLQRLSKGEPDLAVQIIQQSVDHCWQGLFELKDPPNVIKKPNSFFDFSQRNDDLDAMIRREI